MQAFECRCAGFVTVAEEARAAALSQWHCTDCDPRWRTTPGHPGRHLHDGRATPADESACGETTEGGPGHPRDAEGQPSTKKGKNVPAELKSEKSCTKVSAQQDHPARTRGVFRSRFSDRKNTRFRSFCLFCPLEKGCEHTFLSFFSQLVACFAL